MLVIIKWWLQKENGSDVIPQEQLASLDSLDSYEEALAHIERGVPELPMSIVESAMEKLFGTPTQPYDYGISSIDGR